jgi:hypothetical protein
MPSLRKFFGLCQAIRRITIRDTSSCRERLPMFRPGCRFGRAKKQLATDEANKHWFRRPVNVRLMSVCAQRLKAAAEQRDFLG